MIKHSKIKAMAAVCAPIEKPEERYLMQTLEIACEDCGGVQYIQIIGHHIPAVIKILQKALEQYPDLCQETTVELPSTGRIIIPHGGQGRVQ